MFKNMNIGNKLMSVFFAIIISLLILGSVSIFNIGIISKKFETFYKDSFVVITSSAEARQLLLSAQKDILKSIEISNSTEIQKYIQSADNSLQQLERVVKKINDKFLGDKKLITNFTDLINSSNAYKGQILDLISKNSTNDNNEALKMLNETYMPTLEKANDALIIISNDASNRADNFYNTALDLRNKSYSITFLIIVINIIFVIVMFLVLKKSIVKPILEIEKETSKVSLGKLNIDIKYNSKDELGKLADSTRKTVNIIKEYIEDISYILGKLKDGDMTVKIDKEYIEDFAPIKTSMEQIINSLKDTISNISLSSKQVSTASKQVSLGANTLSQGSNEQASAIQELVATINEISENIKTNAEYAQNASLMATNATENVKYGSQQMDKMIKAINEINIVSNQIIEIVKTIDDIASETNLLALNASIEAAHAGESGAGFSIIANEVNALATQSSEAARKTATLIENAIQSVKVGTEVANETAQALNSIVEASSNVSKLVDNISTQSHQQSQAVIQITNGIEQIASVIENNSTTAEENNTIATELDNQSQVLINTISQFKLS